MSTRSRSRVSRRTAQVRAETQVQESVAERRQRLYLTLCSHADEIQSYFNRPMKVTVIARDPENPEAEALITNDTWEGIEAAMTRAKGRDNYVVNVANGPVPE